MKWKLLLFIICLGLISLESSAARRRRRGRRVCSIKAGPRVCHRARGRRVCSRRRRRVCKTIIPTGTTKAPVIKPEVEVEEKVVETSAEIPGEQYDFQAKSDDKKWIVFVNNRENKFDLYEKGPEGQLLFQSSITPPSDYYSNINFSPDSDYLVITSPSRLLGYKIDKGNLVLTTEGSILPEHRGYDVEFLSDSYISAIPLSGDKAKYYFLETGNEIDEDTIIEQFYK